MALPALLACAQTPMAPSSDGAPPGPGTGVAATDVSPGAAEVVRLAEAGTSDDVILAYIQNSSSRFNLSADNVLYLKDVGLSSQVITGMLNHDNATRNQAQPYTYTQQAYAPTAPPPSEPPAVQEPAPPQAETPPPAYVGEAPPEVNYFYNDLSPYGSWVQLDGVGWCWQPRTVVLARGWRPYCDGGHWVSTDAGWYWQSDYSWGWAPFHYGRWYLHERCGWVWTPDTVWAPAWVIWRSGGDNCGWAPVPPHAVFDLALGWRFNGVSVGLNFDFGLRADCFTFVGMRDFGERDLGHHRLEATEVTRIYNKTTIINNYVVNNKTIINRGIPVERVAAVSHTQIQKATIRDLPAGTGNGRLAQAGGGTVVYRPQLKAPARPAHLVAQKVDAQHPMIQHAAIAPVRTATRSQPRANTAGPVAAPRRAPAESPKTSPSSTGGRSSSNPQGTYAPRASAPSTTPTPVARSMETPRTPVHTATTYAPRATTARPTSPLAQEPKQAARSPMTYQTESGSPLHPVHSAVPAQSRAQPSTAQAQNTHTYYPKTYHQAAESHSFAPPAQRSAPANSPPASNPGNQSHKNPS